MKIKSILAIVSAVLFLGCKDGKTEAVAAKKFRVTLDVIANKDDDFCLLYTTDGTINFTDKVVWQHVKANSSQQQVVFDLPENVKPTQLRIDVGFNKEQEEVVLKGILLENNGNKKEIKGQEIRMLFRPDESKCTYDSATGAIKAVVKDGQKQVPSMYPQEANLGPVLKKLTN
ncbi:MAG: hypothetical protein QM710_09215 [Flavobacterium sp.]